MNILLCFLLYSIVFICTDFSPVWVIFLMVAFDVVVFSSRLIRAPALLQGEGNLLSALSFMAFMQIILGGILYLFTRLFV